MSGESVGYDLVSLYDTLWTRARPGAGSTVGSATVRSGSGFSTRPGLSPVTSPQTSRSRGFMSTTRIWVSSETNEPVTGLGSSSGLPRS